MEFGLKNVLGPFWAIYQLASVKLTAAGINEVIQVFLAQGGAKSSKQFHFCVKLPQKYIFRLFQQKIYQLSAHFVWQVCMDTHQMQNVSF